MKNNCWLHLLNTIVARGLKERDYWFFVGDLYQKDFKDYLTIETQNEVNNFISKTEIETKQKNYELALALQTLFKFMN